MVQTTQQLFRQEYLFDFVHRSTIRNELEDTHPIDGNYDEIITYQKRSKSGTVFYQENINTFKALSALTTPIIGGIVSVDTTGAKSIIEDVSSASTTGRTATFRALVEGTNITIDDTSAPGYLIINSQASGVTTVTGIQPVGSGSIQILSSVTNNDLVYKTISAGTGVAITESNGTLIFSKSNTYFTTGITTASKSVNLASNYLYDNIILTSSTSTETVTAFTSDSSISSYTPSIRFFAQTGLTVTFQNSNIIKTEGGLDAVIVGSNYDSITFEYNTATTKFYQTNINNYI
jgi:hypothetical protein